MLVVVVSLAYSQTRPVKPTEAPWQARREVFTGDFPTSTLVQVAALAEPSVRVEIEAIAHIGAGVR